MSVLGNKTKKESTWKRKFERYQADRYKDVLVTVEGVSRLKGDIIALHELLKSERPTERLIAKNSIAEVIYGFGDTSGSGFGASWVDASLVKEDGTDVLSRNIVGKGGSFLFQFKRIK